MPLNPEQQRLRDLPVGNVLVIAPAGCGKTDALAARAAAAVSRGDVQPPSRVLGITFSNKARDNLASRLSKTAGPRWRERIQVTNFHGLAARVIKAHGALLGIPREVQLPEAGWRKAQLRDIGIDTYPKSTAFEDVLHRAKSGTPSDDEVMEDLVSSHHEGAIEFERRLRAEHRLDYEDLIRHGGRLLADERVRSLYRAHFGLVLVDEVQDLTVTQYEMVQGIGGDTVTYAGDPAQGIYTFTGADPDEVFARIHALNPEVVEFNTSYRSSPAVLRAVNALAQHMGATPLVCGAPEQWPDEGHVISLERPNTDAEAEATIEITNRLLADNEDVTIGVIGRRGSRSAHIRDAAEGAGVEFEDWSIATHSPAVVALIQRFAAEAITGAVDDDDAITRIEERCRAAVDDDDASTIDELSDACTLLRELVSEGLPAAAAVATCRPSPTPGAPVAPGLHLLTGHKGKGQEFDWVFVVGLEDGHIPDFRSVSDAERSEELRVLHVIASRARHGIVVTFSRQTPTKYGWRDATPSPWLETLRQVATELNHL